MLVERRASIHASSLHLIAIQIVNQRGGLLAVLAEKGERIAFQENRATAGADLKFVMRAFADPGKENFPHAAAEQLAHRRERGHPSH